jgi:hypothetical protein
MMNIITADSFQFMQAVSIVVQGFFITGFFQFFTKYFNFFFQFKYSFKSSECYFQNRIVGIKT